MIEGEDMRKRVWDSLDSFKSLWEAQKSELEKHGMLMRNVAPREVAWLLVPEPVDPLSEDYNPEDFPKSAREKDRKLLQWYKKERNRFDFPDETWERIDRHLKWFNQHD